MISGVKNGAVDQGSEGEETQNEERTGGKHHAYGWKCAEAHDGTSTKGPNEWLAAKFDDLHDLYEGVQGKNAFAIRQYSKAASILRRTTRPITNKEDALTIKGIGQSIADRVSGMCLIL